MLSSAILLQLVAMRVEVPPPDDELIVVTHVEAPSPDSMVSRTDFSCVGNRKISFEYANEWQKGDRGVVRSVKIDDREIKGLAKYLSASTKNRSVKYLSVITCGTTEKFLPISAEMVLSDSESTREQLPPVFFFQFDEEGVVRDQPSAEK